MKVVAFLPAKGSSSRIESKNLKLFDGKPLFMHTLEKLMNCDFIDEVYLDTESSEVIEFASETGCLVLKRDPLLADNKTDGHKLFMNEANHVEADIYIQILGTSPFIEVSTIRNAVEILKKESCEYDSAILVRNEKLYTWQEGAPTYNIENIPNSFDLPSTCIETMGLYIMKGSTAHAIQKRIGRSPLLLEATALEAIDVNWPEDFELAELIAAGQREKDRRLLNNIKTHLSSCMLSDLLDDLGFQNQIIKGLLPNFGECKILGRAKTLKLRPLQEGEDFKGIYHALHSYATIIPNDIIMVENQTPEYAYFGELNANLAIRSGAAGVVLNGNTRDSKEVRAVGIPVFSKGYTCQDVRKRATTDSINKKININNVLVSPGDLIFGDSEGVVVIPKSIENEVIAEIYKRVANEKNILIDISMGADVDSLIKNYGFF